MKNYYILSNGRLKRQDNTLYIESAAGKKPIPVEDVDSLYLYGEVDINTKLLTFISSRRIPLHVFNYYGFYAGSYYPREYLHSGYLLVRQVGHYSDPQHRMALARELVRGSAHSLIRNVAYYCQRRPGSGEDEAQAEPEGEVDPEAPLPSAIPADEETEAAIDETAVAAAEDDADADPLTSEVDFLSGPPPLTAVRDTLTALSGLVDQQAAVNDLRGVEGKMRLTYYRAWGSILTEGWRFDKRVRRPPDNEVNALISFGNGVLYTACLSEIYRTQLTPTISYLHEPGARRFSLALDLSEIFKPLLVDRAIFRLLNTGQLKPSHFDRSLDGCYLTDDGKRLFLGALEERFNTTIKHRRLGRHVSYRHLIRLECYKLIRHLTDVEEYRAFRAWW